MTPYERAAELAAEMASIIKTRDSMGCSVSAAWDCCAAHRSLLERSRKLSSDCDALDAALSITDMERNAVGEYGFGSPSSPAWWARLGCGAFASTLMADFAPPATYDGLTFRVA